MSLINLGLRAALLLGLAAAFLVVFLSGLSRDTRPASPIEDRPAPTATPSPTLIYPPTPLPPQDQVCLGSGPPLTQVNILSSQGFVIVRIYCSGDDLKYVTSHNTDGLVERTYLFKDGVVRVKLYHDGGDVVKREDFDKEGNLVPDGTYFSLPNSRIGPGLAAAQP
jgi:hypothetical protein